MKGKNKPLKRKIVVALLGMCVAVSSYTVPTAKGMQSQQEIAAQAPVIVAPGVPAPPQDPGDSGYSYYGYGYYGYGYYGYGYYGYGYDYNGYSYVGGPNV